MSNLFIPLDPTKAGPAASNLETKLRELIVGQDEAVMEIVKTYQMHIAGMCAPNRSICNFLFLGPTGSGKTRIVEATAQSLFNNPRALTQIDCAEFQHSHEIAKLIGSPPGYLGHRETHAMLSQEELNLHHTEKVKISLVLFDEIEKASDALWHLLLGILDKARLNLGDCRRVDFSNCMVFMTSNLGAAEMCNMLNPMFGFMAGEAKRKHQDEASGRALSKKLKCAGTQAARKIFSPEFFNRLDKIVTFQPLGMEQLQRILDIELGLVRNRISLVNNSQFEFVINESARSFMLEQGTDVKYGARPLKRAIERLLVHPFSNLIATGQLSKGDWVHVKYYLGDDHLSFTKTADGQSHTEKSMAAGSGVRN